MQGGTITITSMSPAGQPVIVPTLPQKINFKVGPLRGVELVDKAHLSFGGLFDDSGPRMDKSKWLGQHLFCGKVGSAQTEMSFTLGDCFSGLRNTEGAHAPGLKKRPRAKNKSAWDKKESLWKLACAMRIANAGYLHVIALLIGEMILQEFAHALESAGPGTIKQKLPWADGMTFRRGLPKGVVKISTGHIVSPGPIEIPVLLGTLAASTGAQLQNAGEVPYVMMHA